MNLPSSATLPALIIMAYLLGSIPFAIVISKLFGLQDPRQFGSGNPGATNVLRTGNKTAAALTLLGDAAKGWLAVWIALRMDVDQPTVALTAFAVFIGHLYPIFLKFKGGKGVATALGVLFAIQPWLALATIATWILIAVFFKYSSLAAIIAAIFAPIYFVFGSGIAWKTSAPVGVAIAVISLFLLYRHRANISRLVKGTEPKIGSGKKK